MDRPLAPLESRLAPVAAVLVALAQGAHAQRDSVPANHVLLISIDGFAAFHLRNQALDLPNIRALMAWGTHAESGQTVFPSVTPPSQPHPPRSSPA